MARSLKKSASDIVINKKAHFDYFIEESLEAGISLEGWEVKSLRSGKVQLNEGYIVFKDGKPSLIGASIIPLSTAASYLRIDPMRTRYLLLHKREINSLKGKIDKDGMTVIPLSLYWSKGKVKLKIGLAKGKKQHDKRQSIKERDWNRDKQRVLKNKQN